MPNTTDQEATEQTEKQELRKQDFRRELFGTFIGISLAMMVSALLPQIRENYPLTLVILWGAIAGGLFASYERFERAGAALTHSESAVLNYAVGLSIPSAVLLLLYLLSR